MNVIKIDHLTVNYGETIALRDISMQVQEGEFLGIIGPNGGGKSTLLKAILGLVATPAGKVQVFGKSPSHLRGEIGYVPQFAYMDRKFPISVFEVALLGRTPARLSAFHQYSQTDRQVVMQQLEKVGIAHLSTRQIGELSGGEFQRLLIARALAVDPKLLLLDEPTASVDAVSREKIYNLLDELNQTMTIIMVTHDLFAVSSKVRKLACLNGTLVYHGEPQLQAEIVNQLYGCPVDLIAHGVPHRVLGEHGEGCCHV